MGSPRGAVGARPPSHAAYLVALAGMLVLLLLLCCYFVYFCIKRVKELSRQPDPARAPISAAPARAPAAPPTTTYPIQPGVRDTATAMARLCKQLPATASSGGTVFPAASSPAAQHTDVGAVGDPAPPSAAGPEVPPPADKTPAPLAPPIMVHETPAAR